MLYQFNDKFSAANELARDKDLGEGRPVSIELQPFLDARVLQHIEMPEFNFHLSEVFNE